MSPIATILLIGTDGSWRVGVCDAGGVRIHDLPAEAADEPERKAVCVRRLLQETGGYRVPMALVIPGGWCFSVSVPLGEMPRNAPGDVIALRAEDYLPRACEDLHLSVCRGKSRGLVVAVDRCTIDAILASLGNARIGISRIFVAEISCMQRCASGLTESGVKALRLDASGQIHLLVLDGDMPGWWYSYSNNPVQDRLYKGLASMHPSGSKTAECRPPLATDAEACLSVVEFLEDRQEAWVEFCGVQCTARALAQPLRRPLLFSGTATAVLLLVISIASLVLTTKYKATVAAHRDFQQAMFTELFPTEPVPPGVMLRIQSEARRSRAMNEHSYSPRTPPADVIFLEFLRRFPETLRAQVLELRLGDGRLYLEGVVRPPRLPRWLWAYQPF